MANFLLCRKIFSVMYYKIEMCQMLHSAVKFRPFIRICRK